MKNQNYNIPWRDNSSSMMTIYSILSAMDGAFLAIAITDEKIKDNWIWPISLLAFSLICLIVAIEKFSDALDENDVDKYLTWLLSYNAGVISMFFGIASDIYIHFHLCSFQISNGNIYFYNIFNIFPYLIAVFVSRKWICDLFYLLFQNNEDYINYRKELLGEILPEPDSDLLMKFHQFIRKNRK